MLCRFWDDKRGNHALMMVVAMIPILGGLVWFAAVVFGLGVLVVAIWRARTTSGAAPAAA